MTLKQCLSAFAIAVAVVWMALPGIAQAQEKFAARVSPMPMEGAQRIYVAGIGSISAALVGKKLTITGSFEGLRSPATIARIHRGLATGVRGSPFHDLTVSKATSGTVSGSFDLTDDQVDSLRKGKLYIQIHTEKVPDGNLWGWFLR